MHIVHLARRYAPLVGGVETHVAEVNRQHVAAGHLITVITIQEEANQPLKDTVDGVTILRIPRVPRLEKRERSLSFKLHLWKWMRRYRSALRQADIVHVHDVFWWVWPVYPTVAAKLFITFHGWEGQYPVRWQARVQRWVANQLSQGVIHVGAWIQEFYGDHPDYVVYGGSDTHRPPAPPLSSDVPSEALRLVFVGRLEAVNEVKTYLELLRWLKQKKVSVEMTWVGDGSYRDECQTVGTVTGMVANPEPYLEMADLVFANSYLSLLEAQAVGAAVVAVYTNPLKQRYLETYPIQKGLLIGTSAEEISQRLEKLAADSSLWEKQTKTAAQQAGEYTWAKVAQVYLKLWRKKSEVTSH